MKTNLNFEDIETKKLLLRLDFQFFLNRNADEEKYPQSDLQDIYNSYSLKLKELENKSKENIDQHFLFAEGQVRKMFTGGFLPALFHLDETRQHIFIAFSDIGNNWAYFEFWKKHYQKKVTREQIWNMTVKVGSVLAIVLSLIKLIETIWGHNSTHAL
jgi:hypothetical protein